LIYPPARGFCCRGVFRKAGRVGISNYTSMENNKYKVNFVERTKNLLENNFDLMKEKEAEVTFLLNCLLGLIITVSENEKISNKIFSVNIDESFLEAIPEKIGFRTKKENTNKLIGVQTISIPTGNKNNLTQLKKSWFINKLRNGIAHQNIEAINENQKWVGIRLWNNNNSNEIDFEIEFTIEELKKIGIKIASEFLEKN